MKSLVKKIGKTVLSVSILVLLILVASPIIAKILDLVFNVAVKE